MKRICTVMIVALAVTTMVACAAPTAVPVGAAAPTLQESAAEFPEPFETSTVPDVRHSSEPVSCNNAETAAVSFSTVDAALGHRYLFLTVRNCTDEPLALPSEPVFEGVAEDGTTHPELWEWDDPQGSLVLAPNQDKTIQADWLSNGRCERGVPEMRLHLFDQTFSEQDCFQFGGGMAPEREGAAGNLRWIDDPNTTSD